MNTKIIKDALLTLEREYTEKHGGEPADLVNGDVLTIVVACLECMRVLTQENPTTSE